MLSTDLGPNDRTSKLRDSARTRQRLLRAAFPEMHRSGFRSADMNAILAAARVTKGALYHHFDSKESLGYAVVDEVLASISREKWVWPLQNAKNPIDALVAIVQSTSCRQEDLECGCSLNNLSQEMSPLDEGFRRRTGNLFKEWHDAIALALRRGQKLGLVRSDVDASETAIFLIAAYEGFISLVKNSQDLRMHQAGQKSIIRFLESLHGRRGSTKKRQVKAG
jgi:TetR/AcrR family transcriptional regulator, transcriptional repressor for nem operon